MKVCTITFAMWTCAVLSSATNAATSLKDDGSLAEADLGRAAVLTPPSKAANSRAGRVQDSKTPGMGASTGSHPRSRAAGAAGLPPRGSAVTPPRGVGQTPRSNADRLRVLLKRQEHGHLARQPYRSVGRARAAAGGPELLSSPDAKSIGRSNLVSSQTPKATSLPTLAARGASFGASRIQGFGQVDGRAFSRKTRGH
jgi:hypothetical protein